MTEAALLARVCDSATDEERWASMLVLADWLEEQGDARCEAWRLMVADQVRVVREKPMFYGDTCVFYLHLTLPDEFIEINSYGWWYFYPTVEAALLAAAAAFIRAKAAGWAPEWPDDSGGLSIEPAKL